MASKAVVRVIVHPTKKGYTWTQVSRNGSAAAVAPKVYDSKSNAKRAGERQVATLNGGITLSSYAALEVVDKNPGYV